LRQIIRDDSGDVRHAQWLLGAASVCTRGPRATLEDPWIAALPEDPSKTPLADSLLLLVRGYCRLAMGRLRAAEQDFSTVLAPNRPMSPFVLLHAHTHLAVCHYLLGDWERAAAHAERARSEVDVGGFITHGPFTHGWAAIISAGQGRWDSARKQCRASSSPPVLPVYATSHGVAAAAIAQAHADPEAMYDALRPALVHALADEPWPVHQFWPMWVEALTATGRLDEAQQALARLREDQDVDFLQPIIAFVTGELALAQGSPAKASVAFDEVLDQPLSADYPPLHLARLEQAAGRLQLRLGNRQRATRLVFSARDRLQALGATPFLAQLEPDLAAVGCTENAVPPGLVAELSARELDIARCAAEGLTNREIAKQLFVSAKTVEYHMSHIFAKLDLSSRRQLRQQLQLRQRITDSREPSPERFRSAS
jgi:DNA-binding CsgD family transcriptional regulator